MDYRRLSFAAATIALVTCAVYFPALSNGFVNWDDNGYVYENAALKYSWIEFTRWAFTTLTMSNWHPLTWLSLKLDYFIWGMDPAGFHLTNVLLHGANTALVVLLAGLLFSEIFKDNDGRVIVAAALTGILFGVHPLHVESVAWISERKDVLYSLFMLCALICYVGFLRAESARHRAYLYGLCLLSFALSLMSKPMAVTLPAILLILDYYPFRRILFDGGSAAPVLREKLPFFALSLAAAIVAIVGQSLSASMAPVADLPLLDRLLGAAHAQAGYLLKTVWPSGLSPFYPLDRDITLVSLEYLLPLLFFLATTLASLVLFRRAPLLTAVWAYFIVSLSPVIGIIQVGNQAMADRYMYLPILAPLVLAGALAARVWRVRASARIGVVAMSAVTACLLAVVTVRTIPVWSDSFSLWARVIEQTPNAAVAHLNLGNAYRELGDLERAAESWRKTLEIEPRHSFALNQLGVVAFMSRDFALARHRFAAAVAADETNAEARYNLALVLEALGRLDEAHRHYAIFLETAPAEYGHLFAAVRQKLGR